MTRMMRWGWESGVCTLLALGALITGIPAGPVLAADLSRDIKLDIPASMPLQDALLKWGAQTGMAMIIAPHAIGDQKTQAMKGTLPAKFALAKILDGSGLSYDISNNTVVITPVTERRAADAKSFRTTEALTSEEDPGQSVDQEPRQARGDQEKSRSLAEVVVTGTNITGVVNKTVPLITITRQEIDDSGYTSTQQVVASIPQNFSGGQTGASETGPLGIGSSKAFNISSGTSLNLRGLGTSSTLVLIDGHRISPSMEGTGVDVSLIPLAAIDHIDVLTDGASAVYGSDAVGGVVNFVLRKDYDGAEADMTYGHVTSGSLDQETVGLLGGHHWDGGSATAAAQFDHRDSLPVTERPFSGDAPSPTDLLPKYKASSFMFNAHQQLVPDITVFTEGNYTQKISSRYTTSGPIDDPFNESGDGEDHTNQWNLAGGIEFRPTQKWSLEASAEVSSEHDEQTQHYSYYPNDTTGQNTELGPPGYLDGQPYDVETTKIWSGDIKADGRPVTLPAGELNIAFGASHRYEDGTSLIPYLPPRTGSSSFARRVNAYFGEMYIPLVGASNSLPFIRALELSAAVRHDSYSDVGGTTNPRVGLLWSPISGLNLRGSYSTSFRAPSEYEIFNRKSPIRYILVYPFAAPGGGTVPTYLLTGSNPIPLRPENSKNYSFGADFTPESLRNLRLTFDYYRIDYRDRITSPPIDLSALLHPNVYGPLIGTLANDAAAASFLQSQEAQGATLLDIVGTGNGYAGVRDYYSVRQTNAARQLQSGFDIGGHYKYEGRPGVFETTLNATVIREIQTSYTENSTPTDIVNTYGNPMHFRARGGETWSLGGWRASGFVNYSGHYTDTTVIPSGEIPSWTTVDLSAAWSPEILGGAAVSVSVLNALNTYPPRTGSSGAAPIPGLYYDVANGDPLGRFISMTVGKRW